SVAEATEEIAMTGVRSVDNALANAQAGFDKTPDGYTWHHVQDTKTMQLIPMEIHNAVAHTGGVAVIKWLNKFSTGLSVIAPYMSALDPTYYAEQMAIQGCNGGNVSMCGSATMFGAEVANPNAI
ncbi:HNH endonuclease signature motif containing protein, partial [Pseudoalteromonas luteoviolacea]